MKPAVAKSPDSETLEDLGRATLQIVHDLKNQLNGLKLYATFLRKRLEQDDQRPEERQTLAKLIIGLDRAAAELTALVRYARPLDVRPQPLTDLKKILEKSLRELETSLHRDSARFELRSQFEKGSFQGSFDPAALAEAFRAIGEHFLGKTSSTAIQLDVTLSRISIDEGSVALIEFNRDDSAIAHAPSLGKLDVYLELATKIFAAHNGSVESSAKNIQVRLPLS